MNYALLPKVELHVHLDCCLSYAVVRQLDPSITEKDYRESFIAPPKCTDLADYITRAIKGFELMQTKEQIRLVTLDLFEQLKADAVVYAEIRFAPLQHTQKGLSPGAVVEAVIAAVEEGVALYGVEAGILLCTLRHYTAGQSMQTVQLANQYRGTRVIGFDIAADERGFPIDEHCAAFAYAYEQQIPCTAHAGEARGADSVWETLDHFFPKRIGHGVRSMEDDRLVRHLVTRDIHLEVCVTSNIQTNVYDRLENHTVQDIYAAGISMSVNTDARTISDTNLSNEYRILERVFGWEKAHFLRCNLEAIRHSFTTEAKKAAITRLLLEAYQ
ncbi:adenosine deaminase [Flavihumibacter fluvii]|uniref:adenosine deaminase n=1 Tax=Flavihumibacter fluvii TaxID=2838157 RepID=UPI001BDEEE5D|nr:adenosine deaminase [Flavihumibacter fluvii]ULQ51096.1 adenosine deaminase [Flavihumibacter fluvii]